MDATLLARIQFGVTVGFHYIFPQITIGMAWILFWMMARWVRTGQPLYRRMARFWTHIFALVFAVGVATGIVMEFQFGTNWADYSRFVGDIFGAPLAAEGVIAFFLESTFLGMLLFGWKKLSPKVHLLSAGMVAFGSTLSAFWIIVANSWQQTPAGFKVVGTRAEMTSFAEAVFNPSTIIRYLHTVDGALIAGSFFVLSLSAWFLLKKKHIEFAVESMRFALIVGLLASGLQFIFGHHHAVQVYKTQPLKLAAFEGHFESSANAPLLAFGIPDVAAGKTQLAIALPGMLSFGVTGDFNTVIKGLNEWPREEWPPILLTFFPFHLMVALWVLLMIVTVWGVVLLYRKKLPETPLYQWLAFLAAPAPILASTLGWMTAEIGRQPWIVYGLLKTNDAVSKVVSAGEILFSLLFLGLIYLLLFGVWVFLVRHRLLQGPETDEAPAGKGVTA
ncbi:MAG: cytochrome ubiquinol oxidase subunit I [Myxococcales bacterium]|nr:cytochrome ubiquinol oxidase subunit I [Myxococcales bacterium]